MSRVDRAEPDWEGVVRVAAFLYRDLGKELAEVVDAQKVGMIVGTLIERALNEIHHRINGVE